MKKLAKKTTCYFCKYIIINTQKCRYVTYKNTKKPICRYCKASKYKPLNKNTQILILNVHPVRSQ